jgi:hypothetical protein
MDACSYDDDIRLAGGWISNHEFDLDGRSQ